MSRSLAEAKRLCPEWRSFEFEVPDEAGWPDKAELGQLVKLLQAGPRQPQATSAARAQDAAARREQAVGETIGRAVDEFARHVNWAREVDAEQLRVTPWTAIPAERHEEVLDRIAEKREQLRADFEERQAKSGHQPYVLEEV